MASASGLNLGTATLHYPRLFASVLQFSYSLFGAEQKQVELTIDAN